jgi:hypothetical protein
MFAFLKSGASNRYVNMVDISYFDVIQNPDETLSFHLYFTSGYDTLITPDNPDYALWIRGLKYATAQIGGKIELFTL